jgi:hypothetical protein
MLVTWQEKSTGVPVPNVRVPLLTLDETTAIGSPF